MMHIIQPLQNFGMAPAQGHNIILGVTRQVNTLVGQELDQMGHRY